MIGPASYDNYLGLTFIEHLMAVSQGNIFSFKSSYLLPEFLTFYC